MGEVCGRLSRALLMGLLESRCCHLMMSWPVRALMNWESTAPYRAVPNTGTVRYRTTVRTGL